MKTYTLYQHYNTCPELLCLPAFIACHPRTRASMAWKKVRAAERKRMQEAQRLMYLHTSNPDFWGPIPETR